MRTRTLGTATITLPGLDEPGLYLTNVDTLDNPRGAIQDFAFGDADLRSLGLSDTRLVTGHIHRVCAQHVGFEALKLHDVEITGSDLRAVRWSESRLTRVVIRDTKLLGAALNGLVLDNVLFENCKLGFTSFTQVRATGPVAFAGCVLTEATSTDCDLSDVVFSGCTLRLTVFGPGRYRNVDLRGNGLSTVRGIPHLTRARIGPGEQHDLIQVLVTELEITVEGG